MNFTSTIKYGIPGTVVAFLVTAVATFLIVTPMISLSGLAMIVGGAIAVVVGYIVATIVWILLVARLATSVTGGTGMDGVHDDFGRL